MLHSVLYKLRRLWVYLVRVLEKSNEVRVPKQ